MEHKEFRIPLLIARARGNVASDIFSRRITFLKMSSIHQEASKNTGLFQCHKLGIEKLTRREKLLCDHHVTEKVFLLNSNSRPRSKMEAWSWEYHLGQYSYTYTTKTFDTLGEVVYECTTHGKCTCGAAHLRIHFFCGRLETIFVTCFHQQTRNEFRGTVTTIAKNKT